MNDLFETATAPQATPEKQLKILIESGSVGQSIRFISELPKVQFTDTIARCGFSVGGRNKQKNIEMIYSQVLEACNNKRLRCFTPQ